MVRSLLIGLTLALMTLLSFSASALTIPDGDGHITIQPDILMHDAYVANAESVKPSVNAIGDEVALESNHKLELRAAFGGGEGDGGGEEIAAFNSRHILPNDRLNL